MAERVEAHLARFNAAVRSGDWTPVVAGFDPDARMEFANVPVGPFLGRAAIASAYAAQPPDDTIVARSTRSTDTHDDVEFDWSRGGSGRMALDWTADGLLARLRIEFT